MSKKFLSRQKIVICVTALFVIGLVTIGFVIMQSFRTSSKITSSTSHYTVIRQDLSETLNVSGQISSANYSEIKTQAIGTVKEVYVSDGQEVKTGDKLFLFELSPEGKQVNQTAYANYLAAKNGLNSAQNQLHSLQITLFEANGKFINNALAENKSTDDPDYIMQNAAWLAAENSYKNQQLVITQAQAQVASSWQNYQNTNAVVTAPTSGTIDNISAVPGLTFGNTSSEGTNLSDRLATLKTSDKVLVTFDLVASEISKVNIGQQVTLTSNNIPSGIIGTIVSVDRFGNTDSTTIYPVIAEFSGNNISSLLPNLSVDGEIALSQALGVLAVPTIALQGPENQRLVQIINTQGESEVRSVDTGLSSGNLTEIISGLSENEVIAIDLPLFQDETVNRKSESMVMMSPGTMAAPAGNGGMSKATRQ